MKLGSETGSLVNHLMSTSSNDEPNIGTPATLLSWSDRAAAHSLLTGWLGLFLRASCYE